MNSICVVEDESSLAEMISLNLRLEGFEVAVYTNGMEALTAIGSEDFSLVILDVMLPGLNGVDVCRKVRQFSSVPILFLSARGTTSDRIEGLKAGGNDYLPKPFDLEELLLRVRILTKTKKTSPDEDEIRIGEWQVNFKTYETQNEVSKEVLTLSRKEIDLIRLFAEKEGEVVSREEILDRVWGKDQFPTTRTIDNFILQLRRIFEKNPKEPEHFHSVRGVGYKFTSSVNE